MKTGSLSKKIAIFALAGASLVGTSSGIELLNLKEFPIGTGKNSRSSGNRRRLFPAR